MLPSRAQILQQDEIIKRKLLIEGDGGNDDRRITSLLKMFIKWTQTPDNDEDSSQHQRLLSVLAQCEHSHNKSRLVYDMNGAELLHYDALNQNIESKIHDAYEKISQLKSELLKAKRIRRNRQEYDALAKVIQTYPDRQETLRKLEELDKELDSMKETKQSMERKLELRRKQFHVLIASIHELERILEEDEHTEEDHAMDTT